QGYDEPQRDLVILLMIEEAAAPRVAQRPTLGMNDSARFMLLGRNVPQFLDSDTEYLWTTLLAKLEYLGQPLGQVTACAFREEGIVGVKLHARLVIGSMRAIPGNAHVAGRDALHRAVVVEQDLRCRKTGEDLDPELLRLPCEPATQVAQAQRVRALVVHEGRHQPVREGELAAL